MAHNRTTDYSAPFHRAVLLKLPQYLASPGFISSASWDRSRRDDLYVTKGTVGRSSPAKLMIVGVIASDDTKLEPHGNWSSTYGEEDKIGKVKLQVVVGPPADDALFNLDYDLGLKRLHVIQDDISDADNVSNPRKQEHFILAGGRLKMNFLLFIDQDLDDDAHHYEGEYEVKDVYKSLWAQARTRMHVRKMAVYGTDQLPVDYRDFVKKLKPGTSVEVTFSLFHYAIRDRASRTITSETFSAHIDTISILKVAPSTIKSMRSPSRRPVPSPSSGPSRGELVEAARFFVPPLAPIHDMTPRDISPSVPSVVSRERDSSGSPEVMIEDWVPTRPVTPSTGTEFVEGSSTTLTDHSTSDLGLLDGHQIINHPTFAQMIPFLIAQMKNPSSPFFASKLLAAAASESEQVPDYTADSVFTTSSQNPSSIATVLAPELHEGERSPTIASDDYVIVQGHTEPTGAVQPRTSNRLSSAAKANLPTITEEHLTPSEVTTIPTGHDIATENSAQHVESGKSERREQKKRKMT